MAKTITDDDGTAVTAGCTIHFGFGIPPTRVVAKVIERDGKLIALTPDHTPTSCDIAYVKKHFNFWVITKPK